MTTGTEPTTMAPAPTAGGLSSRLLLHDIPWTVYEALRAVDANDRVRMTYHDGTLELISPEYVHEKRNRRLATLVQEVAVAFGVTCEDGGSTTFQRPGPGPKQGSAREPDTCFYLAHEPEVRENLKIDLNVDPPPDLAIEVDNTRDSEWKLSVFAALGVPEVWRHDARTGTLWFGRLQADGSYASIERSEALPMLGRAWVLDTLGRGQGMSATPWIRQLRDWIRDELGGA